MEPSQDASNPEQVDLSRPGGCKFGLGLARGFSCLFKVSLAWRPLSLGAVGPVQPRRVQGLGLLDPLILNKGGCKFVPVWLEAFCFIEIESWLCERPEGLEGSRELGDPDRPWAHGWKFGVQEKKTWHFWEA